MESILSELTIYWIMMRLSDTIDTLPRGVYNDTMILYIPKVSKYHLYRYGKVIF